MTAPVEVLPAGVTIAPHATSSRCPRCSLPWPWAGSRTGQEDAIDVIVDGVAASIHQPFSAAEVLRLGGTPGAALVIRIDGGRASGFAPDRPVAFDPAAAPVFRTFRGPPARLHVDGLRWDWGAPVISVAEVRAIRGVGDEVAFRIVGDEAALPDAMLIDVSAATAPRLRSGQGSIMPDRASDPGMRNEDGAGRPPGNRPAFEADGCPNARTVRAPD